jgi:diguanylate cyclase (GGDEF)-like protein
MYSLTTQLRKFRNWWFYLCTGSEDYGSLDEEQYRLRILVMASFLWLLTVLLLTVTTPLIINLTQEGALAADILFVCTGAGVLFSMLILRFLGNRMMALNVMLLIYGGAFAGACLFFGGTQSPTYPLLLLAPAMAAVVGSVTLSITWGVLVVAFWLGLLLVERQGFTFLQIIDPLNHSMGMMLSYTAMSIAVVSIIIVYAEMNRTLRTNLQSSNLELEHLSSHDQLTRLPNRRSYDERMAAALHRASEQGTIVGLLFMDLNDFKKINDAHGHGAGDMLLTTIAQRLQQSVRETDLVARLGGDEFAAVLEDVESADEITRIAHKLSQAMEQPISIRQHPLNVGASIGIATFPGDGRQKQELEEKADKAMYHAKKRGIPVALASLESSREPSPARQPVSRI